jgi:hypothetical protein
MRPVELPDRLATKTNPLLFLRGKFAGSVRRAEALCDLAENGFVR